MKTAFELNSFNELNIKGYHWHAESENHAPLGIVVIAHGMAETILRYDAFAEYLVTNGFTVYGYSHRGHFETAGSFERLGYLGENGWSKMAVDLSNVITKAQSENKGIPTFIFGHSMGSYVTRTYLVDHPDRVDGIVLSGTGFPAKLELQAGGILAKLERVLKRKDKPSKLLDKMSFGAFNKSFVPNKTAFDWLSTDTEQVKLYIDNPWCGQLHPSSFFEDMAKNLVRVIYDEIPKPKLEVPMLIMSGALDPVGQMGVGVKKSADFYKKAGYKVDLKLYENGRHEMLNEVNRDQVFKDVKDWFVKNI